MGIPALPANTKDSCIFWLFIKISALIQKLYTIIILLSLKILTYMQSNIEDAIWKSKLMKKKHEIKSFVNCAIVFRGKFACKFNTNNNENNIMIKIPVICPTELK